MKNNLFFIRNLISSLIITILLIYFFIKTPSNKIIFIPFLICGIVSIFKSIFLIIGNPTLIILCNKLYIISFLLFWFGFLIYWCYQCFIIQEYLSLLFSIPFWLVGINIIKTKIKTKFN